MAAPFGPLRAPMGVRNWRSEAGLRRVRKCGAEAYGPLSSAALLQTCGRRRAETEEGT